MKKLANLFLMLALLGLPIACGGGADFEVPPVTENPNPPANPDPPQVGPVDTPDIQAVETPNVCRVEDPDCDNDSPEIGPIHPPDYGKVGDRPQVQAIDPTLTQINPCLEDPEAEGCE